MLDLKEFWDPSKPKIKEQETIVDFVLMWLNILPKLIDVKSYIFTYHLRKQH